jgi:hypothetical protein
VEATATALAAVAYVAATSGMIPGVQTESFLPEVSRKLGWYVYRLIDPRNGETFDGVERG